MDGIYYKEWSAVLDRAMEFKRYGHSGVPVLALPARGGRFYDWENNGMPEAVASLLHAGKVQLFCADSIDGESLLAGTSAPRRRAEMQEKYFLYLTTELAPRILALTADKPKAEADEKAAKAASTLVLWCAGVDTGAYQAVNCRLRRPELFAGAIGLSGLYDMSRFMGSEADDLILRNSPLNALAEKGIYNAAALAKAVILPDHQHLAFQLFKNQLHCKVLRVHRRKVHIKGIFNININAHLLHLEFLFRRVND